MLLRLALQHKNLRIRTTKNSEGLYNLLDNSLLAVGRKTLVKMTALQAVKDHTIYNWIFLQKHVQQFTAKQA